MRRNSSTSTRKLKRMIVESTIKTNESETTSYTSYTTFFIKKEESIIVIPIKS